MTAMMTTNDECERVMPPFKYARCSNKTQIERARTRPYRDIHIHQKTKTSTHACICRVAFCVRVCMSVHAMFNANACARPFEWNAILFMSEYTMYHDSSVIFPLTPDDGFSQAFLLHSRILFSHFVR